MTTIFPTTPASTTPSWRPASRGRALLAGLLFALPLVLGTPEAEAGPAGVTVGNWRYVDRTDVLGNRSRFAYTRARGSDPNLLATFVLRERNGEGQVLLYLSSDDPQTSPPVLLCQMHGAPPAIIMFDDRKPLPTLCATEDGGDPRTLFLGPVLPIWRSSAASETLSIGVDVPRQGMVAFTFFVGDVEWRRILDPDQVRYLDRMTERGLRGEDTTDMWDMTTSQDLRKGIAAERPKQRSQAPKSPVGVTRRDLRS